MAIRQRHLPLFKLVQVKLNGQMLGNTEMNGAGIDECFYTDWL
jgi:hypothetical protein